MRKKIISEALIKKSDFAFIIKNARGSYPRESCGLIGIKTNHYGQFIIKPVSLENESNFRNTFRMSARNIVKGEKMLLDLEYSFCGCYHTHVSYPAKPSPIDSKNAKRYELWLIYSLFDKKMRLFQKGNSSFVNVILNIL